MSHERRNLFHVVGDEHRPFWCGGSHHGAAALEEALRPR